MIAAAVETPKRHGQEEGGGEGWGRRSTQDKRGQLVQGNVARSEVIGGVVLAKAGRAEWGAAGSKPRRRAVWLLKGSRQSTVAIANSKQ